MISAIVCVDSNWGIGKTVNGKPDLLFSLPKDMNFFKTFTSRKIVVMGYNTLLSLPKSKPLKNRVNIVLCPEGIEIEDCICVHNFEQTVSMLKVLAKQYDVVVMGGAMFYKSMLPYCDEVQVTKVFADGNAEVFFPNLDLNDDFELASTSGELEDNGYTISLNVYRRK